MRGGRDALTGKGPVVVGVVVDRPVVAAAGVAAATVVVVVVGCGGVFVCAFTLAPCCS